MRFTGFAGAAAQLLAGPAAENDSAAELAAGGLELVATDAIAMQREDLVLSLSEVRVRYEMRNDTGQPVTLRVAFPMPEVPHMTPGGMTTGPDDGSGPHNIALQQPTDPKFLGFRVQSNGREIKPEVDIRATLQPGVFVEGDTPLAADTVSSLQALGALEKLDDKAWRLPWITRIAFHWMQTFAPGVTVVEHSYRPVIGTRFIVPRDSGPIEASDRGDPMRDFCIDGPTDKAIRALAAQKLRTRPDDGLLSGHTPAYILQTARTWRGPIGTFHLTLTGGPITGGVGGRGESRVMSLCTDLPPTRTGPQRLEATVRDYVPKEDLRILFVSERPCVPMPAVARELEPVQTSPESRLFSRIERRFASTGSRSVSGPSPVARRLHVATRDLCRTRRRP